MILILSQSKVELTTEDVINWIQYYNGKVTRINGDDLLEKKLLLKINNSQESFKNLTKDKINIAWFRRYKSEELNPPNINISKYNFSAFKNHLNSEFRKAYDYYVEKLTENAKIISSLEIEKKLNKIIVLEKAKKVGLKIPNSIITNNKSEITNFVKLNKDCIIKPLSECIYFFEKNYSYDMLTERIRKKNLEKIPDIFIPSLIQENILKMYEIRSFYFLGEIYSMAIFSQNDKKTKTDFRNYNNLKPNRTVPYKLPNTEIRKLKKLMSLLKLDTGSIDLIRDKNGNYIFLEVNPNGQLGMVSEPCNYYLEEKIALKLMELDKKQNELKNKKRE